MKTHIVPPKYFITRCTSTFSDEEQDSLLDTAEKIATYECFFRLFEQVNQSLMVFGIQIEDSSMHYRLRPIKEGQFRLVNFASHFIRVQIFQIDFPLILYL